LSLSSDDSRRSIVQRLTWSAKCSFPTVHVTRTAQYTEDHHNSQRNMVFVLSAALLAYLASKINLDNCMGKGGEGWKDMGALEAIEEL